VRQKDGMTPLMIAVANGDAETAGLLLAKGADPNLRAAGGKTALSLAKDRNSAPLIQLLRSRGAKD
jgi:ankyrin repeat protein